MRDITRYIDYQPLCLIEKRISFALLGVTLFSS